jgi:formamidopyrimidine-DNA glycosylase
MRRARADRGTAEWPGALSCGAMPELPEVETVARDLRRHLLPDGGGPDPEVVSARVSWARTLRDGNVEAFLALVPGRRIEAIGRRGKQLVIDLSGGAFLTVHLKMTGQLFVVPGDVPPDPYERLALALADGRELRFRDIRKFGRIGLYLADEDPFDEIGPEPLDPAPSRCARSGPDPRAARPSQAAAPGPGVRRRVGNIYADEALWRARLHPLRTAATLRPGR